MRLDPYYKIMVILGKLDLISLSEQRSSIFYREFKRVIKNIEVEMLWT